MGTGKLKICKEDRGIQPLTERKEYANSYRVNVAERVLNAYEVRNLMGHALRKFSNNTITCPDCKMQLIPTRLRPVDFIAVGGTCPTHEIYC